MIHIHRFNTLGHAKADQRFPEAADSIDAADAAEKLVTV